jgi:hypothetical protein
MLGCSSKGRTDPDFIFSNIFAIPRSVDAFHFCAAAIVRCG